MSSDDAEVTGDTGSEAEEIHCNRDRYRSYGEQMIF